MSNSWAANLVNLLTLAMLPIYIGVHVYILPPSLSVGGITDAGFISIITLTLLGSTLVTLLTLIFNTRLISSKLTAVAAAYVIFIYFLREADLHRLLTIEHVTRSKFYTMSNVPMWQKVFAASILILLVVFLVYLLFRYARVVWVKVRSLEPWAVAFLLWFIILFISQLSDKSGLNHTHIGRVIEECSECWATAFIFLTVIQIIPTLKLQRSSKTQH